MPSAAAPRMILSSMSVRFMTHVTRRPAVAQVADEQVREQERAEVADVGGPVDRGAAAVDPDVPGLQRLERADLPGERVLRGGSSCRAPHGGHGARRDRPPGALVARQIAGGGLHVDRAGLAARATAAIASRMASSRCAEPGAGADDVDVHAGGRAGRAAASRATTSREQVGAGDARAASGRPPERGGRGRPGRRRPAARPPRRGATTSPSEWPERRGAPAISMPPRRRPVPGPNGWLSWPKPTRDAGGDERLFDPAQVVGEGHLEVRGFAGDRMDRDGTGLEQRGLVGELPAGPPAGTSPRHRAAVPRRAPCGVCAAASADRSTVPSDEALPHPLERLRHRAAPAAPRRSAPTASTTASTSAAETSGRAPSWTSTGRSRPAGSTASSWRTPAATDCWRVAPPATTAVTPAGSHGARAGARRGPGDVDEDQPPDAGAAASASRVQASSGRPPTGASELVDAGHASRRRRPRRPRRPRGAARRPCRATLSPGAAGRRSSARPPSGGRG